MRPYRAADVIQRRRPGADPGQLRFYSQIQRIDAVEQMVFGFASTTGEAGDGLTITRLALEDALSEYMKFGNVREMHQQSAIGVTREATVSDDGMYVGVHVVDDSAWKKVTAGVYRGFSIGAKITSRDPTNRSVVRGISLIEISLVDRPLDPGAIIEVWRASPGSAVKSIERLNHEIAKLTAAIDRAERSGISRGNDESARAVRRAIETAKLARARCTSIRDRERH